MKVRGMKLLLVGPYPPPHGGVSVHVAEAQRHLRAAGIETRVINVDRRAAPSAECINMGGRFDLFFLVLRHGLDGWTPHVHTNGHNLKSWLLAGLCGLAGIAAPARLLTLHSGMAGGYLAGSPWRARLARFVCRLYGRIVCVNPEIRNALAGLRVPAEKLDVLPAFLDAAIPSAQLQVPEAAERALAAGSPVLSTALFFRHEYGFDLLLQAIGELRATYPSLVCLVMGSGEREIEARTWIARDGLQEAVILLGDVPHQTCLALMARSDVYVRPTRADADAISVREALALGVPVVASNVGLRPEGTRLCVAGDAGSLTAALREALSATAERTRRSGDGMARLLDIYRAAHQPDVPLSRAAAEGN